MEEEMTLIVLRNSFLSIWQVESELPLAPQFKQSSYLFFLLFLRDGKAIIRATANRKKETSAKEMSREILFLVLTAHYYVRRVSSSQSVSVVVTREASYVF
jgi:hypothetical protein